MDNLNSQIVNEELKIVAPEGYEIDKENSTFERIKFKKKDVKWRNSGQPIKGYWIDNNAEIHKVIDNLPNNYECHNNVFSTKQLAKSALAMAQISQIIANDERFGGPIKDYEWNDQYLPKHIITNYANRLVSNVTYSSKQLLAFHTFHQRELFHEENEDLIKEYFMID